MFHRLFVLDLFVSDVLVYYFYICFENLDNLCYSYAVIESSFFVYCYSLNSDFVNYLVISFDNCYNLIFGDLICCLSNFVIDLYIVDFDSLNNFCSYCWNNFCVYCMMSFFFYHLNSVYS